MNYERILNPKRTALLVCFSVVVLVFVFWLYGFLTSGTIIATSSGAGRTIVIVRAGANKDNNPIVGENKLKVKVKRGSYLVQELDGKLVVSEKTVLVKAHTDTVVGFEVTTRGSITPVLSTKAASFIDGSGFYKFVDVNTGFVSRIGFDGVVVPDYIPHAFNQVLWIDSNRGYGDDQEGNIYYIDGTSYTKVALPDEYFNTIALGDDGSLYISVGSTIYKKPSGGSFVKLFESSFSGPSIVANKGSVTLYKGASSNGDDSSGEKERTGLEVFSSSGKLEGGLDGGVRYALWSPGHTYLFVSHADIGGVIYDKKLRKLDTFDLDGASSVVWANDESLYYPSKGTVFSYSTKSGTSHSVSDSVRGDVIEMSFSKDTDSLVLSTFFDEQDGYVSRLYLDNRTTDSLSKEFLDIMPLAGGPNCTARFISGSTKFVGVSISGPEKYDACVSRIGGLLSEYGEDYSSVTFVNWPGVAYD